MYVLIRLCEIVAMGSDIDTDSRRVSRGRAKPQVMRQSVVPVTNQPAWETNVCFTANNLVD